MWKPNELYESSMYTAYDAFRIDKEVLTGMIVFLDQLNLCEGVYGYTAAKLAHIMLRNTYDYADGISGNSERLP